MAGRKIGDEDEARECLAAVAASGLTRAQWARLRGVDGRSLRAWQLNLERRGSGESMGAPVRLVELVATGGSERATDSGAPGEPSRYVIRCGQLAVELDAHFDEAVLQRLLRVVVGC